MSTKKEEGWRLLRHVLYASASVGVAVSAIVAGEIVASGVASAFACFVTWLTVFQALAFNEAKSES